MKLKIRQERESRNWTQEYVARETGISKPMVHDIETGRRKPSYDVLVKLEDLFNANHRDLFVPIAEHD